MGVSTRHTRRILAAYRADGAAAHGHVIAAGGRPAHRLRRPGADLMCNKSPYAKRYSAVAGTRMRNRAEPLMSSKAFAQSLGTWELTWTSRDHISASHKAGYGPLWRILSQRVRFLRVTIWVRQCATTLIVIDQTTTAPAGFTSRWKVNGSVGRPS